MLSLTIVRGALGFVQVMGIVAAGAAAEQRSYQKNIEVGESAGEGVLAANGLPDMSDFFDIGQRAACLLTIQMFVERVDQFVTT